MHAPFNWRKKPFEIFSKLKQKLNWIGEAVKFLKTARWKGVKDVAMNDDDGGGSGDDL